MRRRRLLMNTIAGLAVLVSAALVAIAAAGQKNPKPPPPHEKIAFLRPPGTGKPNQVFTMYADGTGQTQLTSDKTYASGEPDWSPDSDLSTPGYQGKIAYRTGSYWGENVFVMDPSGANKYQITHFGGISRVYMAGPRWSPDGQYLAFAAYYMLPESDMSECGIWVYGPIGPGKTPTLQRKWFDDYLYMLSGLSWTPDLDDSTPEYEGKLLVRLSHPNDGVTAGFRAFDVTIAADGYLTFAVPQADRIVLASGWLEIADTPYGLRAAWSMVVENAYYGIGVAPVGYADGVLTIGTPANLTPVNYLNARPRWSWDGTRIVYDSAPAGSLPGTYDLSKQEVYSILVPASLVGVGTTANPYPAPNRLTSNQLPDWLASWSPAAF